MNTEKALEIVLKRGKTNQETYGDVADALFFATRAVGRAREEAGQARPLTHRVAAHLDRWAPSSTPE